MIESPAAPTSDARRAAWEAANVSPLWENRLAHNGVVPPKRALIWPWERMKPLIDDAASMKAMDVVERRVLSLVDPAAGPGGPFTVTNFNAGLQILLPGESARPHRHSMNALRYVIDGQGATTIVDGKACPMNENDLILTPGWSWHEHQHDGTAPIVWLDILDAALHRYLGTDQFEPGPAHDVPQRPPDSAFAYANLVPDVVGGDAISPVFSYPYATAAAAVAAAPVGPDGARRVRYVNPATGGAAISFLDCYLMEIEAGTTTLPFWTSAHAVCAVAEGEGSTSLGESAISWRRKDVFALPNRCWITHRATRKTRLFISTDRDLLRRLDLLDERLGS